MRQSASSGRDLSGVTQGGSLFDEGVLHCSVHEKRRGTVEVRLFALRVGEEGGAHRLGTLCMPERLWAGLIGPLLEQGAREAGKVLTVDWSAAERLRTVQVARYGDWASKKGLR